MVVKLYNLPVLLSGISSISLLEHRLQHSRDGKNTSPQEEHLLPIR